jgi:hypothetical protein
MLFLVDTQTQVKESQAKCDGQWWYGYEMRNEFLGPTPRAFGLEMAAALRGKRKQLTAPR